MLASTIGRAAVVAGFTLSGAVAWAAGWEPAAGDQKNAVQSCAAMAGDDYVCTFVRCDAKGSLNFYAAAPGPDITGNVVMDIDGQRFPMTFRSPGSPQLASTNKADALPPGFLAALKTGKVMKIREAGLKAGYDTIPLNNADREIGRIEKMCGVESAATPTAPAAPQAPTVPPANTDALRQGVAQGAAFCKAHLASAPADLKLGEVEEFCTCMGVHEFAMTEMTNDAKASLRPRQQQMCMEIVRKQEHAPAPAAAPSSPPSPPMAPVVAQPAPETPSFPTEKYRAWTIAANRSGAPIAFVPAVPSQGMIESGQAAPPPKIEALLLYCQARDTIGVRVLFKPGANESLVNVTSAGHGEDLPLDQYGVATSLKRWSSFVKDQEFFEKKPDIASGPLYVDLELPRKRTRNSMESDPGGSVSMAGLTATRSRMRALCANAAGTGKPIGNFDTTGIDGFPPETIVGAPSRGTPASQTPVREPKVAPRCNISEAQIRADWNRLDQDVRARVKAEFMNTGALSNATACQGMRRLNAFHQATIKKSDACEGAAGRKGVIGELRAQINKNNAAIRRNNWCG